MSSKMTFEETTEALGLNLYIYRMGRKLSIKTVAAAVKVTPSFLAGVENGRWPHVGLVFIAELCYYYGLPLMAAFEFCGP